MVNGFSGGITIRNGNLPYIGSRLFTSGIDSFGHEIYEETVKDFLGNNGSPTRAEFLSIMKKIHPLKGDYLEGAEKAKDQLSSDKATSKGRFFYTNGKGWIDVRHFLATYLGTEGYIATSGTVKNISDRIERRQAVVGNPLDWKSAYSVEDLVSNELGIQFEKWIDKQKVTCYGDFLLKLDEFIRTHMGGYGRPPALWSEYNNIKNLGIKPVLDPYGRDILITKDGMKYKSSGNYDHDVKRLEYLKRGKNFIKAGVIYPKQGSDTRSTGFGSESYGKSDSN